MLFNATQKANKRLELKRILRVKLQEKYGLRPEAYISERLEDEWRAVEKLGLVDHILLLVRLVRWLKKKQYPYWMRGTASSSLMLYLLGVTRSNPLPAHYYCPTCKKVMWMVGCKDGFDLTDTQLCQDKTVMLNDGHDLPWQNAWGVRKGYLEIDLPKKLQRLISRYYNIYYGRQKYKDIDVVNEKGEKQVRSAKLRICCYFDFEYEKELVKEFVENSPDQQSMFSFWEFVSKEIEPQRSIRFSCQSFSDLLALKGLVLGEGAWDKAAKEMLLSARYTPADLIAFKEDIFYYLREHGFSENDAWIGTKNILSGYGLRNAEEGMDTAPDGWKLERCRRIRYLFSKATLVEYMLFKLQILELLRNKNS